MLCQDVLQAKRRMEKREGRYERGRDRHNKVNQGNRMGNLMCIRRNRDKCQMAWAPVISRAWGDASDLRSVEHATSRKCQWPLIQTTEPCELRAQEQDQTDHKQLAGVSMYH